MNENEIKERRKAGHIIRLMNRSFKHRFVKEGLESGLDEVTIMHGWIMGYLACNQDKDIYQKTIEQTFGIGRSSVTSLVQLMEKKGFINREAVEGDARLKRIRLTEEGLHTAARVKNTLDDMEKLTLSGIDDQDLETFFKVAEKIQKNLDN